MHSQFLNFIIQKKLFTKRDKILLTVSGGIDSIVLFELLMKNDFVFAAAHCNFGLRGKESDGDEDFVKQLCKKNKIAFHSKKFNTAVYAEKNGISTQMAARDLRYEWFEDLRKEIGFDLIATAHHQTDVTETMLINLVRGTGIAGLHGISAKKGKIVRPLLFVTRREIETYSKQHKLSFREDSSNSSDDYLRNKIRHWVLPQLQKINPDFEHSFFETAARLSEAETVFNSAVAQKRKELEQRSKSEIRYPILELKKLNPLSIYLFEFLKTYNFTSSVCLEIERSLDHNSGNLFYSNTHRLLVDRNFVIISKLSPKSKKETFTIVADQAELKTPIHIKVTKKEISSRFKISKAKSVAQLDASKINFPLEIRRWKTGDSFYPLGMKGNKKLSDFFIDIKLSLFDKEKIWLLCSGKKIVWVINHRIDERFKIDASTQRIIRFECFEK